MLRPRHSNVAILIVLVAFISACSGAASPSAVAILTITSHADGDTVGTSTIQVRGTAPAGAEIVQDISFAGDRRTSAESDGSWVLSVDLDEGPNDLKFRIGSDDATYKTIRIIYDPMLAVAPSSTERAAPSSTARTTLQPTPMPTPRPTPEPTSDPGTAAFQEFATHITVQGLLFADGMSQVSQDASNFDIDGLVDSSIALWSDLGDEVDWLDDHPPASCYAALHAKYSEAIDLLYEALDLVSDGAIYVDVDLLTQGTELMGQGTDLIEETPDLIDAATEACA